MSTANFGIRLGAGGLDELITFSDSDWAGDPITRTSNGGYVIYMGNSILCWSSKSQGGIFALSSTESEFIQLYLYVRYCTYNQFFATLVLRILRKYQSFMGIISQQSTQLVMIPEAKSRTKHIDIRLKFCGEVLAANKLKINM